MCPILDFRFQFFDLFWLNDDRTLKIAIIQQTTKLADNDHAWLELEPDSMDQIDDYIGLETEYALAMDDVLVKPIQKYQIRIVSEKLHSCHLNGR